MVLRKVCFVSLMVSFFIGCSESPDTLIKGLYSKNFYTRRESAFQLQQRRGDRETTQKLIELLNNGNEQIEFITIQILGNLADTTAVGPIGGKIKSANPVIRSAAMWTLGSLGHDSALPYIVQGLSDPIPSVRYAAVTALGDIHYLPAVKYIYPMFRDPVDSVRTAAIQAHYSYRAVKGAGVLAADLAGMVKDPNKLVRYVAVQALGGGYPDSIIAGDLLIESLKDEEQFVRLKAIVSLKQIHCTRAIPILKEMYDLATVEEEFEISETIREITGEQFPPLKK